MGFIQLHLQLTSNVKFSLITSMVCGKYDLYIMFDMVKTN